MSTIPSLALIPSGVKASKVYSVLPTNGTGDFDFTRSGNATRVNSEGLIELVSTNVPRLNYPLIDGVVSGCPSLLLEPQRTNLIPYSEDFSNAAWSKEDLTVLPNQAISPDGTLNADLLLPNTNNTDHSIYDQTNVSTEIFTVFLKAGGYNFAFLGQNNAADTNGAFFDLINGTVTKNSSALSASIEDYGNGWFRCSLFGSFSTDFRIICPSENGQTFSFAGDGVKGVYSWGAQVEAGSYPTSYIPSLIGSQTTRSAETCEQTPPSGIIGLTQGGVIYMDFMAQNSGSNSQSHFWIGSAGNEIGLYGGNQFIFYSSGGVSINGGNVITGQIYKVAFAYETNDYVAYVNGVQVGLDNSATYPNMNNISINSYFNGTEIEKKQIKDFKLYNTRLSNAELQALTSWDSFSDMAISLLYTIE